MLIGELPLLLHLNTRVIHMKTKCELINNNNKFLRQCILGCLLLILSAHANSAVEILTVNASTSQLQDGSNATVFLNWSGVSEVFNAFNNNTNVNVVSNAGNFLLANGSPLSSVNRRLSTTVVLGPLITNASFSIRETLRIPASVIFQARERGAAGISFVRTFSDGFGATRSAAVNFQIVSSSGGQLTISRVDLRFDNDQIVRIVSQGEKLSAIADINYNGVGQFVFNWEVAAPASTQGEPLFLNLKTQRRYLGAGREAYVQSPNLPTQSVGTYLVRIDIRSPEGILEPVEIKYAVRRSTQENTPIEFEQLKLQTPTPEAVFNDETLFEWAPIKGVAAYQLELYEDVGQLVRSGSARSLEKILDQSKWEEENTISSGLLIPGNKHSVHLTPVSRQHLISGKNYQWRVVGIDIRGRIIAKSQLRSILVP